MSSHDNKSDEQGQSDFGRLLSIMKNRADNKKKSCDFLLQVLLRAPCLVANCDKSFEAMVKAPGYMINLVAKSDHHLISLGRYAEGNVAPNTKTAEILMRSKIQSIKESARTIDDHELHQCILDTIEKMERNYQKIVQSIASSEGCDESANRLFDVFVQYIMALHFEIVSLLEGDIGQVQ